MARRGGPQITREHADKIVRKLKAERLGGRAHDLAVVRYNGREVAAFGIRRASSKDTGHGHIPKDLSLSPSQVLRLANCPMSYEEWVNRMKEKNLIPREDGET